MASQLHHLLMEAVASLLLRAVICVQERENRDTRRDKGPSLAPLMAAPRDDTSINRVLLAEKKGGKNSWLPHGILAAKERTKSPFLLWISPRLRRVHMDPLQGFDTVPSDVQRCVQGGLPSHNYPHIYRHYTISPRVSLSFFFSFAEAMWLESASVPCQRWVKECFSF